MRPARIALALAALAATPAQAQNLNRLELFTLSSSQVSNSGLGARGSVAVVPDVTGDGRADLAFGASLENTGAGRVYVINGVARTIVRVVPSPQTVQAEGFGSAVAGLGDVTGDGRGDLVVGAPGATAGAIAGAGRAYIVDGATGAIVRTLASPNPASGGRFGLAVSGVPDVDGDGRPDVAVGAPRETAPGPNGPVELAGRAYLFSGATGALLAAPTPVDPVDFQSGTFGRRGSAFGFSLAGLPDVTGDGRGELVVGAPGEGREGNLFYDGRVYFYPSGGATASVLRSPNAQSYADFGESVAATGDLDGDGRADLVVGAPDESPTGDAVADEGQAYLVSGATGAPFFRLVSPEPDYASDFGIEVGPVPDLTGDGRDEVFVTEPTSCCEKMPAVYVFDGATRALAYSVELPYFTWDINAVLGVPDLDGDGRGDLAVGVQVGNLGDEVDAVIVFSGDLPRAEVEPNDTVAEAQPIGGTSPRVIEGYAHGSDIAFNGDPLPTGDTDVTEDLYRIQTTAPGLAVTLTGLTDDVDLYVFRPNGTIAGQSFQTGTASESVSLPTLPAGVYTIGVDFYGEFGDGANEGDYSPYTLTATGSFTPSTAGEDGPDAAAALGLPAPNPFRGTATVAVTTAAPGPARLTLVDVLGREVAVLLDGALAAGTHTVDVRADGLAPGVYVLRLDAGGEVSTRRVTVAR